MKGHSSWLDTEQAWLAHGDFDTTPIFQHQGRYAGIIDFGEIRGADQWYDLGHFRMHDGGSLPIPLLAPLIEGYQTVTMLPLDHQQRICFASLLIGVRTLARHLQKYPSSSLVQHAVTAIRRDLAVLLTPACGAKHSGLRVVDHEPEHDNAVRTHSGLGSRTPTDARLAGPTQTTTLSIPARLSL